MGVGTQDGKLFYGWNANKNMSADQFLENSALFKNLENIIQKYELFLGSANITDTIRVSEQEFRYPSGKCFDFKFMISAEKQMKGGEVLDFRLGLEDKTNTEINVKLTDPNREYFLSDDFTFFGNSIMKQLDPSQKSNMAIYKVQVKENIGCEEDSEANCKDYTTEGRGSYKQCVMAAVEEKFLSVYGCMPPWFTDNIHQVCHQGLSEEEWKNISENIFPTMQKKFMKVKHDSYIFGQNRGYIMLGYIMLGLATFHR